jgi:hypothetical protein
VEFINDRQKVLHRPGDPIERHNQNHAKLAPVSVGQQGIETDTPRFSAGPNIRVLMDNLVPTACSQLTQLVKLIFDALVGRADPCINGGFWH